MTCGWWTIPTLSQAKEIGPEWPNFIERYVSCVGIDPDVDREDAWERIVQFWHRDVAVKMSRALETARGDITVWLRIVGC